jgi:hypothetical protein
VIARSRLLGALDHQRRDLHPIKLLYLTEDCASSSIRSVMSDTRGVDREQMLDLGHVWEGSQTGSASCGALPNGLKNSQ